MKSTSKIFDDNGNVINDPVVVQQIFKTLENCDVKTFRDFHQYLIDFYRIFPKLDDKQIHKLLEVCISITDELLSMDTENKINIGILKKILEEMLYIDVDFESRNFYFQMCFKKFDGINKN